MGQLTNYGENMLADHIRGATWPLPVSWHLAPLAADSEGGVVEITGAGLARAAVTRALASFSGTQGDGTTLASSGTSHATSNNGDIDLGVATAPGVLVGVGFFDSPSGGNCWARWDLATPFDFFEDDHIIIATFAMRFTLGLTGGMSDYLANKLIDDFFRGESYPFPSTIYHALMTSAPTNAGGGVEVGGGVGYARAEFDLNFSSMSSTYGPGDTGSSGGTAGRISNNVTVAHPQPLGSWGAPVAGAWRDAASGGNLLLWRPFAAPISITAASPPPSYAPDEFGITFD